MSVPDSDWGALKSAWRTAPPPPVDVAALRASIRRWTLLSRGYLAVEVTTVVLFAFLIREQWAMGERGVAAALALLIAVSIAASAWVRLAARFGRAATVVGMVDLAIAQAGRGARFAIAAYLMIAASVVYVAVMYWSPIGAPDAAYREPVRVLIVLAVLAGCAVAAAVYHRRTLVRGRRLRALRAALIDGDASVVAGDGGVDA